MKKFWLDFIKRGSMFAWGGPAVLCIIWACLDASGTIDVITPREAIMAVVSTMLIAFIAAGISVVYQQEQLPKVLAALIQLAVLYFSYLGMYLINGWLPLNSVCVFTLAFVSVYALIWLGIYLSIRCSVKKMNARLQQ